MCKKIVALVLALVMMLSVLAACNNEKPNETTQPKETQGNQPAETKPQETEDPGITFPLAETLEVSAMITQGNSTYPHADNLVWKYLQEQSNIKFNFTEFPSGESKEKMNLLLSSGDYPELVLKTGVDIAKFGADGIFIPLEDLIRENMPNLCAVIDELDAWSELEAGDGHIYSIPFIGRVREYSQGGMRLWINQKWLDAVGMEMPTSKEELYQVLKAFKEKDPNGNGQADEIPLIPRGGSSINSLMSLLNIFGDTGYYMTRYMSVQDGEMVFLPTTEYFKEDWIKYLKKFYDEGLLHPDSFTIKAADIKAIATSGDVVGMVWLSEATSYYFDNGTAGDWVTLKPFNPETFTLDTGITNKSFAITDKCQNPEIILAFFDQFYTEEGGRLARLGIDYTVNADGTFTQNESAYENYTYQCTLLGGTTLPFKEPDLYFQGFSDPQEQHCMDELYTEGYGTCVVGTIMPTLVHGEDYADEISALYSDINSYVRNYVAECVTGVIDVDATWADFQNTLKQMDVERMMELYNTSYQNAIGD